MKNRIRIVVYIMAGLVMLLLLAYLILHKPLPAGEKGNSAEMLADKILEAVNDEAWIQTRYIRWTFKDIRHYVWDKNENLVEVLWDDFRVIIHTESITGMAWKAGDPLQNSELNDLVQRAWSYFCNDSFWMAAPFKIRDPGTTRQLVSDEKGDGLLVTYHSGGVTPGDAYLWRVDDAGLPYAWQMWVSVIPVGGVETTWENWTIIETGAKIATMHKGPAFSVAINQIRGSSTIEGLALSANPFDDWHALH